MRAFLLLISLCCAFSGFAQAREVRLVAVDYPPYNSEHSLEGGSMDNLAKRAFAAVDYQVRIDFRPWARALIELRKGEYDGILALWPDAILAEHLIASEPLFYSNLGFFVRSDTPVSFNTLQELSGRKVGVTRGYRYTQEILSSGIVMEEAVHDLSNLRKLAARRFDLVLLEQQVGEQLIEKHPELQGKLTWQGQIIEQIPLYIGFVPAKSGEPDWAKLFARGLRTLRDSGEYQRIQKEQNRAIP